MRENGQNENAIQAFILKISRKLRDCYLSGLAERKVTRVTMSSPVFFCVCVPALLSCER